MRVENARRKVRALNRKREQLPPEPLAQMPLPDGQNLVDAAIAASIPTPVTLPPTVPLLPAYPKDTPRDQFGVPLGVVPTLPALDERLVERLAAARGNTLDGAAACCHCSPCDLLVFIKGRMQADSWAELQKREIAKADHLRRAAIVSRAQSGDPKSVEQFNELQSEDVDVVDKAASLYRLAKKFATMTDAQLDAEIKQRRVVVESKVVLEDGFRSPSVQVVPADEEVRLLADRQPIGGNIEPLAPAAQAAWELEHDLIVPTTEIVPEPAAPLGPSKYTLGAS
jgi:hypothetical protein